LIQPLVENAVRHALPSEGKLSIEVIGEVRGADVYVYIKDDGVGMDEETCRNILSPKSHSGLGIAVGNVNDRIKGFFGPGAHMKVESQLGVGTIVTLVFTNSLTS
ncbi:MAG: ATP-binding protein, partial [Eggerthellaceae bacterium]|nr:ATP-binding protein [Eggerthellaceae bacterium]